MVRLALLSLFFVLAILGSPAEPGEMKALTTAEERALRVRQLQGVRPLPQVVVVPGGRTAERG
jgi:hypothetical protein